MSLYAYERLIDKICALALPLLEQQAIEQVRSPKHSGKHSNQRCLTGTLNGLGSKWYLKILIHTVADRHA
jgi:hypothetical protein